jgi:hypothetical protein
MRLPLYITEYSENHERRVKRASHRGIEVNWSERVPHPWRCLAIAPLWVDVNRDAQAHAERWVGYDEEELPCYCRYRFQMQTDPQAMDGHYTEDLCAWRLRDGRWMIHRIVQTAAADGHTYSFYAFSETMPR